jgi:hypothetical protein
VLACDRIVSPRRRCCERRIARFASGGHGVKTVDATFGDAGGGDFGLRWR